MTEPDPTQDGSWAEAAKYDGFRLPDQNSDWNPPRPLAFGPKPPSFPLAKAFPDRLGEVGEFVAAVAEGYQVPLDLPAMLLLPAVGVSIAQKVEIEPRPGWREVPALYTLSLAESGERKSATFTAMFAPTLEWERDETIRLGPAITQAQEERRIDEARLAAFRKEAAKGDPEAKQNAMDLAQQLANTPSVKAPMIYTSDATSEGLAGMLVENQERGLVASTEADALDVAMGRYSEKGTPNLGIWLKAHCGDSERVVRRGRPPEYLKRPVLSVALTVQPEGVRGMFSSRAARGRGMLGRFLVTAPTSVIGYRKTGGEATPLPDELAWKYRNIIRSLLDVPIDPGGPAIVRLDADAADLHVEFERLVEVELRRGGCLGDRKDWGGKLCGAAARIALVLHCLRHGARGGSAGSACSAPLVDGATMRAALAWMPYLIEHERIVAGVVGCDPETSGADRVLAWIERMNIKVFTRREAFTACRSTDIRSVDHMDGPLALLEENALIRRAPEPAARPAGGRPPSPAYEVNPLWKGGGRP